MHALIGIAEQMIIDRLVSGHAPLTGRSKAVMALYGFAGFLLALAFGYAVYAFNLSMTGIYTPELAALMTAGLCLGLAILAVLSAILVTMLRRRKAAQFKRDAFEMAENLIAYVDEELKQPVNDNPKTALAIASIAGLIAGKRFL